MTIQQLMAAASALGIKVTISGATCIHCGKMMETKELAEAHDAVCQSHPIFHRIAALEAELAAAKRDSARLDHLENKYPSIIYAMGGYMEPGMWIYNGKPYTSLRAAIDAAMGAK